MVNIFFYLFITLSFFTAPLQGDFPVADHYPFITEEVWREVEPYLIPLDHVMKTQLDTLFADPHVLSSIKRLRQAGFKVIHYRNSKKLVVASHRRLKGYLVKTYLEDNAQKEWPTWVHRARGAVYMQSILDTHNLNKYFKVPRKWIYPLERFELSPYPYPKNFILLVEDMDLMSKEENRKRYQTPLSSKFLKRLFEVIDKTGYRDCHVGNLPFSYDGKVALIDLEYYNSEVTFDSILRYLSPANQRLWKKLVRQKQPTQLKVL